MNVLIHFKKQQLETFIKLLILENEKFIKKDFNLDKSLMKLLNDVQEYYRRIGESTEEGNVSQLKTHLDIAVSGIDPVKLERVKTRRRDIVKIACYHCLSSLNQTLENSLVLVKNIINEATENINQVLLSAYQAKLITDAIIKKADTIDKCTSLWEKLKENEQILLLDKKLKLTILQQDISIILDQALSKLKN
ncbi:hypothetical protein LPB136_05645 [Tenacibaculum todarodis]|uniref:Uncharacterized protein n=1 Tax=Tenacibaculum todarodis TaxID=1850252 RepID=A0A1L3JIA1_9FLAO|nr:hypothetical protein [Tenacibaculum todarodis]APG64871.1 hypothetical protein LPB136_05645 [Tenacibaculum todarodis]